MKTMTSQNHFYIDIHVLQTVPPSCVNRDDTGSPKTAVYGGVSRARVSSQSWKHEMRLFLKQQLTGENQSYRTKRIINIVADEISRISTGINAQKAAIEVLEKAHLIKKKKKGKEQAKDNTDSAADCNMLYFVSKSQVSALANLAVKEYRDKLKVTDAEYMEAIINNPSLDMVLFGRMVAGEASVNYDAVSQVAHAISTHEVRTEYDFLSAVDDYKPINSSGAGYIGSSEFNSSTMYRYATLNVLDLIRYAEKGIIQYNYSDLAHAVRCFAEAFICSMPTGKQNTFANRTMPDLVYIAVRNDQPVNLVGAFEKPVSSHGGYVEASENAFVNYAKDTYRLFASEPVLSLGVSRNGSLGEIAELMPLQKLLDKLETYVSECIGG